MSSEFLFPIDLPPGLVQDLARANPWWEGRPGIPLPATRRRLVAAVQRRLERRLAPIIVVRGPRRIGKTIAQLQVLDDLLRSGTPPTHILRVQCDELPELNRLSEPILRIVDWYERAVLKQTLNEAAQAGRPTYLFFDEVQNLQDWAPQLKHLVDLSRTQVVVTGSSALRIALGRDSLAGRIEMLDAGVLSLTEIASFRGLNVGEPALPDNGGEPLEDPAFWRELAARAHTRPEASHAAFAAFAERGGYPLAHERSDVPWPYVAQQLNETVIERVISHDLRLGERGRKRDATLLKELFRLACRYAGQAPKPLALARELQNSLGANVGPPRVVHYLKFLGDTLLLRLIEPLEIRLKRSKGHPKLCLADHGLRASWLREEVPLEPEKLAANPDLATLAGRIAESVVGAALATVPGIGLNHLPERDGEPEVDFVLTIGARRVPIEVKYQRRLDPLRDTEGVRRFLEKTANQAAFGVVITQTPVSLDDPRIVVVPLPSFLLLR